MPYSTFYFSIRLRLVAFAQQTNLTSFIGFSSTQIPAFLYGFLVYQDSDF